MWSGSVNAIEMPKALEPKLLSSLRLRRPPFPSLHDRRWSAIRTTSRDYDPAGLPGPGRGTHDGTCQRF
jgi:hypothetical protein